MNETFTASPNNFTMSPQHFTGALPPDVAKAVESRLESLPDKILETLLCYYIEQGVETKEDEALYEAVGNEFDNRNVKAKEQANEAKKALLAKIKEAL
jgi:hypothetical protein